MQFFLKNLYFWKSIDFYLEMRIIWLYPNYTRKCEFSAENNFFDRNNLRSTIPIWLNFGYVVQNGDLNIISKNDPFLGNTKDATKNVDISVRI